MLPETLRAPSMHTWLACGPNMPRLAALFAPADVSEAERLLARECAEDLPSIDGARPSSLERLRFAALRLSDGNLQRLRDAIALAKTDWRDLLVAADFADDIHAHQTWQPRRSEPAAG